MVRRDPKGPSGTQTGEITVLALVLLGVTLASFGVGYRLRPTGFSVPSTPTVGQGLYVDIRYATLMPHSWNYTTTVSLFADGHSEILVDAVPSNLSPSVSFVAVMGGSLLPPAAHPCHMSHQEHLVESHFLPRTSPPSRAFQVSEISNSPEMTVCFPPGSGFFRHKGPYLSFALPVVGYGADAKLGQSLPATYDSLIEFKADELSQTAIMAGSPPTSSLGFAWDWSQTNQAYNGPVQNGDVMSVTAQSQDVIVPLAANQGEIGDDARRTFVSGILLGVGGGALIGFLQEAFARHRRPIRKDALSTDPG